MKANAYGHGFHEVSNMLLQNGANRLCVAVLDEGVKLRDDGLDAPIIILGYTPCSDLGMVVEYNLTQTVYELDQAEALSIAALKQGKKARIHIKIDSGMGRLRLPVEKNTLEIILGIVQLPGIEAEGIFTHFANADTIDKAHTEEQFRDFMGLLKMLGEKGIHIPVRHAANSAALIDLPQTHLDMVRPGIILYGHYPSDEVKRNELPLKPVMSLKAGVASVKKLLAGSKISYGSTYSAK